MRTIRILIVLFCVLGLLVWYFFFSGSFFEALALRAKMPLFCAVASGMSRYDGASPRYSCYKAMAMRFNDTSYCVSMRMGLNGHLNCFADIGIQTADARRCDDFETWAKKTPASFLSISDTSWHTTDEWVQDAVTGCFEKFFRNASVNGSTCEAISNADMKIVCQALEGTNVSCNDIQDLARKNMCYNVTAVRLKDANACSRIVTSDRMQSVITQKSCIEAVQSAIEHPWLNKPL